MAFNVRHPIWLQTLSAPGAHSFAMLFALDATARALLATVVPLQLLEVSGSPQRLSLALLAVSVAGLIANFFVAPLTRLISRRYTFTLGGGLLIAAPTLIAVAELAPVMAGVFLRMFASAIISICLNLYILDHIRGRDLNEMEPLRLTFSALAWTVGPWAGVVLWGLAPWLPFALSALCAAGLLGYFWVLRIGDNPVLVAARSAPGNPFAAIAPFFASRRLRLAWLIALGRSTWWVSFFVYLPVFALQSGFSRETSAFLVSLGNGLLFLTPVLVRLGRRFGLRRALTGAFLVAGALTAAAGLAGALDPRAACVTLLVAGVAVVVLDIYGNVPFLRMVKPSQRIPMTGVFVTYRDTSELTAPGLAALVLAVAPLPAFFVVLGALLGALSLAARALPRRL